MLIYLVLVPMALLLYFSGELVAKAGSRKLESPTKPPSGPLNFFHISSFIILALFIGLRHDVGSDWWIYNSLFDKFNADQDWFAQILTSPQEPLFTIIYLVVKKVGGSVSFFFTVVSVLTLVPIFIGIRKYSHLPTMALGTYLFLGYYLMAFNVSRQSMALAIAFVGVLTISRNRTFGIGLVVLACFVHSSTVVFLLSLVIVMVFRPSLKMVVVSATLLAVSSASILQIPNIANLIFQLNGRFGSYIAVSHESGLGSYFIALVKIALIIFVLARNPGAKGHSKVELSLLVLSVIFLILGTRIVEASRFEIFYSVILVKYLPNSVGTLQSDRLIKVLMTVAGIVFFVLYLVSFGDLVPYHVANFL